MLSYKLIFHMVLRYGIGMGMVKVMVMVMIMSIDIGMGMCMGMRMGMGMSMGKLTFHQHVKKMTTNAAIKINVLW